MGSVGVPPEAKATKAMFENDRRDVKDLWNEALASYREILGEELRPNFVNVNSMVNYGVEQMNAFHKWRHDATKVAKLRALFMSNINHIETGAQKLVAAATPAFPPAAAIGTALTFVLAACKSVSADYNVVTAFFEDMNSFLQRVSIIESRLPSGVYQSFLMDVFTSLLTMCAFATKFIRLGRLKKWIVNAFQGDDSALAGARKKMDKSLQILQSATEFQILANSEDTKRMQEELKVNQETHSRQVDEQLRLLESIQDHQTNVENELDEIKQLLLFRQQEANGQSGTASQATTKKSLSRIRSVITDVPGNATQLQLIRESCVEHTGEWMWADTIWKAWTQSDDKGVTSPWLLLEGPPGIGKTYLAVAAYDRLQQTAAQNTAKSIVSVYAFCRDSVDSMSTLKSVINSVILQIADQSTVLCEQLNTVLSRDDNRVTEDQFFEKLIMPMFVKGSKHQLNMIIDSVNELAEGDRSALSSLLSSIELQNLQIRALITTRDSSGLRLEKNASQVPCIQITRQKVVSDLRKIISARLQSADSAYQGLRRLSPYVKNKVATVVEDKADSLLYAEYILRHLSAIGREGAIVRELDMAMPIDMSGLFEKLMKASQRRAPSDIVPAVKSLLAWMAFSFDPLMLDDANLLVQTESGNMELFVEDQIQDVLNRFLWIGSALPQSETTEPTIPANVDDADNHVESTIVFDDGQLEVIFRERPMREYFQQATKNEISFRTQESVAHKDIFLFCCQIIAKHRSLRSHQIGQSGGRKILEYALKYCLQHWLRIRPTDLAKFSDDDKIALCIAFWRLVSDKYGFACALEDTGLGLSMENLFDLQIYDDPERFWAHTLPAIWDSWTRTVGNVLTSHCSNPDVVEYWTRSVDNAFVPLAMAHLENWLAATDHDRARAAYNLARKTMKRTCMRELLHPQFPRNSQIEYSEAAEVSAVYGTIELIGGEEYGEEVTRLRNAVNKPVDSNVHFSTAVLMNAFGLKDIAISELNAAIEKRTEPGQKSRSYVYLARVYASMLRNISTVVECIDAALEEREAMSSPLIIQALKVKAEAYDRLCNWDEGIATYYEIRHTDPSLFIPTQYLANEFGVHRIKSSVDNDPAGPLDAFMSWKPVQRLTLLTDFSMYTPGLAAHRDLLDGALKTGRIQDLINIDNEVIRSLDVEGCGAMWRKHLASIYWRAKNDATTARQVLNQILDSSAKGQEYSMGMGSIDAGAVAVEAVNMTCDILYQLFRSSNDFQLKTQLLNETLALPQRHLVQTVQIGTTAKVPHLLVSARMIQKVGQPEEYQKILQQAFDICWQNLHDDIAWNNPANVSQLAKVLVHMPGMKREAEILLSSQMYHVDPHSPEEMIDYARDVEYSYYDWFPDIKGKILEHSKDLTCQKCSQSYSTWGENAPGEFTAEFPGNLMHTCILCTDSTLCQSCYEARLEYNQAGHVPATEQEFCCNKGQYLKSPMNGWKGIKNGVVYMQDQEPFQFTDFLVSVKARWEQSWQEFWQG